MFNRRRNVNKGWIGTMVALVLVGMVTSAHGGGLDSPAAPSDAVSAMYTVEDVYNRLNTGAAGARRTGAFAEPAAGPTAGTMHTLDAVMAKVPVTNANAATAVDVLSGKVYWGLSSGAWGTNIGTRAYAPVPKSGQTNSYHVGDDAWWSTNNVGAVWPNPRFTVQMDTNCVVDNLTGLIWARNANLPGGKLDWTNAVVYCTNLTYGGYSDWRLPNRRELFSLIDDSKSNPALPAGHPFIAVQSNRYWSSTAIMDGSAWYVNLNYGIVHADCEMNDAQYVWPVRGGGN